MIVVYFDLRLGAVHSKHWSEYAFQCFFAKKAEKHLKHLKSTKKFVNAKKSILTNFPLRAVPQSWLKYTTHVLKVGPKFEEDILVGLEMQMVGNHCSIWSCSNLRLFFLNKEAETSDIYSILFDTFVLIVIKGHSFNIQVMEATFAK